MFLGVEVGVELTKIKMSVMFRHTNRLMAMETRNLGKPNRSHLTSMILRISGIVIAVWRKEKERQLEEHSTDIQFETAR